MPPAGRREQLAGQGTAAGRQSDHEQGGRGGSGSRPSASPTPAAPPRPSPGWAEHELFDSIRTRIYVLDGGRVAESGSHDQLIALGGRYAELFTLQASAYLASRSS